MKHFIRLAVLGLVILTSANFISATREPPIHLIEGVRSRDERTLDLLQDISHGQRVELVRDRGDQTLTPPLNPPDLAPKEVNLGLSLGGVPTDGAFDGRRDFIADGQDAFAHSRPRSKKRPSPTPAEDVQADESQNNQPFSITLGLGLSSPSIQKGKEPVSLVDSSPGMSRSNVWHWEDQIYSSSVPPFQVQERGQDPKRSQKNFKSAKHVLRFEDPHSFKGFIDDSNLAETSSGKKKVPEFRYFSVEQVNDKVWPWVAVMYKNDQVLGVGNQEKSLILDSLIKHMPKNRHPQYSRSETPKISDAPVSDAELHLDENMTEFYCLLWSENIKVLHIIENGSLDSLSYYAEEQADLMKWFLNFVVLYQDITSNRSIHNDNQGLPSIEEYLFYQLSRAIYSNHHENVYQVTPSLPVGSQGPILVSKKKILLSKIALQLLGYYYKNINPVKWNQIFKEDKHFLLHVANFGSHFPESLSVGSDLTLTVKQNWGTALPWKSPISPTLTRNFLDDAENLGFKFESFVESIGNLAASTKPEFSIRQIPHFKSLDKKTWAWISMYVINESTSLENEYVLNQSLRSKITKYISNVIQKHLGEHENLEQKLNNDPNLTKRFYKLIHQIWILNSSLLMIWGYNHSDERVLNEQKKIQDYLAEVFFDDLKDDGNKNSSCFGDQSYFHHIWKIRFEKLIINYFISQEHKKIYKAPDYYTVHGIKLILSLEDISVTVIAVNILSAYYKNQQIQKWNLLFKEDTIMIKALLRFVTVSSLPHSTAHHKFIQASKNFNSLDILPWSAKACNFQEYSSNEIQSALEFLDYQPHHRLLGQWLKNV